MRFQKSHPHIERILAMQEVRRIMGMVFKDPPSSVTTYRRLHIQSIIKVILLKPESELSPCVLTYVLVPSDHCSCYVIRGQLCVNSTRVSIIVLSDLRNS